MHLGDLAGAFSNLEMTLLLYCTGAATSYNVAYNVITDVYACVHNAR